MNILNLLTEVNTMHGNKINISAEEAKNGPYPILFVINWLGVKTNIKGGWVVNKLTITSSLNL